ncbi:hypothetical protein J1TS1_30670 [Shouchella clausii]|uniref:DUF5391 family protein n=1 Tax=Shouchella clausii TaxID=79880 RepID=UPI000BA5DB93|nr:DUF5391 family protein [Shouchella clausii]PAE81811.1 hypothetical protein CHH77_12160 [Shouchella clausii]GIN08922.1 hypothetical protein J1TS1_30670 [Shouchella clausii]
MEKRSVTRWALLSMLLFCVQVILLSLTPLAEYGNAANEFNSIGMWLAVAMIAGMYIVPLGLYRIGLPFSKAILAILSGFGIFIHLIIVVLLLISTFFTAAGVAAAACSLLSIIVNVIWFFAAFRKHRLVH